MSADNYMVINQDGDKYVVTMAFASDDGYRIDDHDPRFDSLQEAWDYAEIRDTEYGVRFGEGVKFNDADLRKEIERLTTERDRWKAMAEAYGETIRRASGLG